MKNIFTAEIYMQNSGLFVADLYVNGTNLLELTTESESSSVAIYRDKEIARTEIDQSLGFSEVFEAIEHLLDNMQFDEPFSCTFAKNVLRHSASILNFSNSNTIGVIFSMTLEELHNEHFSDLVSFDKNLGQLLV